MRGLDGVHSHTKLIRRIPFGEWVTVYFDPGKTTEKKLLAAIIKTRCPRAKHITTPGLRTPFVAAGDIAQFDATNIISIQAPEGWKHLPGTANIQLPKDATSATIKATLADGRTITAKVNVVTRVAP